MSNGSEMPGDFGDESYDHTQGPEEIGPLASLSPRPALGTQWKSSSRTVEETVAQGLSNEDLWMLLRRFDKVSAVSGPSTNR
jgi:hypothetical protein